jgi:hypothetical protein
VRRHTAVATQGRAATYYVAPDASGSGDGSQASPWTLQRAVSTAGPGDVVVLLDGVYQGQGIHLTRSGEPGSPITFRAAQGAVPVLQGADGNDSDAISSSTAVHHIIIEGLWMTNWRYGGVGINIFNPGSSNIVVRYCVAGTQPVSTGDDTGIGASSESPASPGQVTSGGRDSSGCACRFARSPLGIPWWLLSVFCLMLARRRTRQVTARLEGR